MEEEPLSYRAWKWLGQIRGRFGWNADLFQRLRTLEWDLLVLLDACRFDVLADLADDAAIDSAVSPATATGPFLEAANESEIFANTVYVSANAQSDEHSPGSAEHVPVYEEFWDNKLGTVSPEPVYERAMARVRGGDRVVAHTLQPHYPHICEIGGEIRPVPGGLHPETLDISQSEPLQVQALLSRGIVDLDTARRSYRAATKYAWQRARDVAADLSAEGYTVVISADHGELFGEWGFVEHPVGVPVRPLVTVPWVVFEPEKTESAPGETVSDQLAALGYVE